MLLYYLDFGLFFVFIFFDDFFFVIFFLADFLGVFLLFIFFIFANFRFHFGIKPVYLACITLKRSNLEKINLNILECLGVPADLVPVILKKYWLEKDKNKQHTRNNSNTQQYRDTRHSHKHARKQDNANKTKESKNARRPKKSNTAFD